MAIAYDNSGTANTTSPVSVSGVSISASATVGYVAVMNGAAGWTAAVTWGGQAMTQIGSLTGIVGANWIMYLFAINNPPSGTPTITCTGTGSSGSIYMIAASYTGTSSITSYEVVATQTGTSTTLTNTVPLNTTGGWTMAIVSDSTDSPGGKPTANTGCTRRAYVGNLFGLFDSNGAPGTGLQSMVYNMTGGGTNGGIIISVQPTGYAAFQIGTGDGETVGDSATWNTARTVGTANNSSDTDWGSLTYYSPGIFTNSGGTDVQIMRTHLPVDTSALGSSATITSANLWMYVGDNYGVSVSGDDYFILYPGYQASTSSLANSDHDNMVPSGTAWSSTYARTGFTTGAYNTMALNATGISGINKTGWTKIGLTTGGDYANHGIHAAEVYRLLITHANASSNRPYLSVAYTTASAPATDTVSFGHFA